MENMDPVYDRPDAEASGGAVSVRASAMGGCRRALWYWASSEPRGARGRSERSQMALDTGTALEPVVVAAMRRAGWEVEHHTGDDPVSVRVRLAPGLDIVGHPDAVGSGPGVPGPAVIEVKARGPDAYRRWSALGAERSHPASVLQVAVYTVGLLGGERDAVIATMNTGERVWEHEVISARRVSRALSVAASRLSALPGAVASGSPPPRDYHASDWRCVECPFLARCRPEALAIGDDPVITDSRGEARGGRRPAPPSPQTVRAATVEYLRARDAVSREGEARDSARAVLAAHLSASGVDSELVPVDGGVRVSRSRRVSYSVRWAELRASLSPEERERVVVESRSEFIRVSRVRPRRA